MFSDIRKISAFGGKVLIKSALGGLFLGTLVSSAVYAASNEPSLASLLNGETSSDSSNGLKTDSKASNASSANAAANEAASNASSSVSKAGDPLKSSLDELLKNSGTSYDELKAAKGSNENANAANSSDTQASADVSSSTAKTLADNGAVGAVAGAGAGSTNGAGAGAGNGAGTGADAGAGASNAKAANATGANKDDAAKRQVPAYKDREADRKALDRALALEQEARRSKASYEKAHQENFAQAYVLKKQFQTPEVLDALKSMTGVWRWPRNHYLTYVYFTREFQLIFDDEYRVWGPDYHPADFVSDAQLRQAAPSERRAFEEANRRFSKKPELYFVSGFDAKTGTITFKSSRNGPVKASEFTLMLEPDPENVGFNRLVRIEKDGQRSYSFARSLLPQEQARFKTIAYYLMYN